MRYEHLKEKVRVLLDEGHTNEETQDFINGCSIQCDNCPKDIPTEKLIIMKYLNKSTGELSMAVLCIQCFISLQINALIDYGVYIPSIKAE